MIITLFMMGLFQMSMAQGATAHAVMQSSQSLSLDAYSISKLRGAAWLDGVGSLLGGAVAGGYVTAADEPYFVTDDEWYKDSDVDTDVIKMRFIGYLTGGDEDMAESFLEFVRVVDGLDGLDFSESMIVDGDLYLTLKYKLQYAFSVGTIGEIDVKQMAVSRLWLE